MKALEQAVATVEQCESHEALERALQGIVESYGFSSYCFLDIGKAYVDVPFYVGTTGKAWEGDYESNGFVHVDEALKLARRTTRPFHWGSVPLPVRTGKKKPRSLEVMEAASDHGFKQGLDIPFHYADPIGRVHSSICVLMWRDKLPDFYRVESLAYHALHLILIYWMQRSIELRQALRTGSGVRRISEARGKSLGVSMTDREREVIAWAARGKTADDTAEVMSISAETVRWYTKNAIDKLGAGNKTHAVAKALHLGLIDL